MTKGDQIIKMLKESDSTCAFVLYDHSKQAIICVIGLKRYPSLPMMMETLTSIKKKVAKKFNMKEEDFNHVEVRMFDRDEIPKEPMPEIDTDVTVH